MEDFDIDKVDVDISGVFIPRRLEGRMDSLVKEKLRELNIVKTYSDGSVDVDGDVNLSELGLVKLPIKFNKISGSFCCNNNQLTSLEGCPVEVGSGFYCVYNKITSLVGCPQKISWSFDCSFNQLVSLEGCPKEVGEDFNCRNNKLTNLIGCPENLKYLCCIHNSVVFTEDYIRSVCKIKRFMN